MKTLLQAAKAAKTSVSALTTEQRNAALSAMAQALLEEQAAILSANALDLEAAQATISPVMLDRLRLTPERIAVNIRDAKIPDNMGNQPRGSFVDEEGPAAYFSTLPVEAMAQAIRDTGLPGAVSNSAGAFVCNDTMYILLHNYAGTDVRVGFIHVPYLPQQGSPSLPLADTMRALEAAISAI